MLRAYPEAIRAILSADLIVIGPGSLFTSILPSLLVERHYRSDPRQQRLQSLCL